MGVSAITLILLFSYYVSGFPEMTSDQQESDLNNAVTVSKDVNHSCL